METMVSNTAIVGEMFDAFKRGDIDTVMDHMHPDITWVVTGAAPITYGGTYKGKAHTATFFTALAKAVTFQEFEVERIMDAGNHTVVSIGHFNGTVIATGKQFRSDWVMVDELDENGLVTHFHDYTDSQNVANAFM
jgi:ketosteroid isomerase-like protein